LSKDGLPGAFEQFVLLAVLRLGDGAYGMTVRRELEEKTQKTVSLGAVYATLERLEQKGYVRSYGGEATEERGGRAKRFFAVEAAGLSALREALDATDRLRAGLSALKPSEAL
jgi:PadR family transcriptional regulator PadR